MRRVMLASAMVGLSVLSGCGVGLGQVIARGSVGRDDGNASSPGSETSIGLTRANAVTLYDSTGMLVAALGTAGNQYNAQRDAHDAAVRRGAEAGDTYSYSYDVVQPAAGTQTRLTFAMGSTTDVSVGNGGANSDLVGGEVDYFLLDLRVGFHGFDLEGGGTWDFNLGVLWEEWSGDFTVNVGGVEVGQEVDAAWIGMPVGTSVTYPLVGPLSATGGVAIDPLMGLLAGGLSDGGNWFFLEGSARLDFRAAEWLLIWTGLTQRFQPWEMGDRNGDTTTLDIGIAYMHGM